MLATATLAGTARAQQPAGVAPPPGAPPASGAASSGPATTGGQSAPPDETSAVGAGVSVAIPPGESSAVGASVSSANPPGQSSAVARGVSASIPPGGVPAAGPRLTPEGATPFVEDAVPLAPSATPAPTTGGALTAAQEDELYPASSGGGDDEGPSKRPDLTATLDPFTADQAPPPRPQPFNPARPDLSAEDDTLATLIRNGPPKPDDPPTEPPESWRLAGERKPRSLADAPRGEAPASQVTDPSSADR